MSKSVPRTSNRMPRVVSWSNLLWNYATNGNLLAIQKLFAEGKASPYDLNPRGSSALIYTVRRNNPRLSQFLHARRLIELGTNVNASNLSSRESTIHFAVTFDRHEMIPLLLERGADYTAINVRGNNIAHMAACFAGTKTISVLAESNLVKLDASLRNRDSKTPADCLSERSVLTESEKGLHAEFGRFMKSIPVLRVDTADRVSKLAVVHEHSNAFNRFHLPGAYPEFADHGFLL